jgi:hypothetical protein
LDASRFLRLLLFSRGRKLREKFSYARANAGICVLFVLLKTNVLHDIRVRFQEMAETKAEIKQPAQNGVVVRGGLCVRCGYTACPATHDVHAPCGEDALQQARVRQFPAWIQNDGVPFIV